MADEPAEMTRKEIAQKSFDMGIEKGQVDGRRDVLVELQGRIKRAVGVLTVDSNFHEDEHEKIRLAGKADGMKVALSYVEEMLRG